LISDDLAFGERLCSVLRAVHGARATVRAAGDAEAIDDGDGSPDQVVWINRVLDGPDFLAAVLPQLRALVSAARASQLWCVTRGACSGSPGGTDGVWPLSRAVVWGFARSIQQEQPQLRCTVVDLGADLTVEAECELLASEFRRNAGDRQVRYTAGERQVPAIGHEPVLRRGGTPPSLRRDGSYLVTGGAGGLGRLVVERLAEAGAGHVIVASRRPAELEDLGRQLERRDTRLSVWAIDVGDRGALQRELDWLRSSGPPLRGVVHAAGLVRDRTIERITDDELRSVFVPKVAGGWNLHDLTRADPLDFFVMFSSLAGVLGSPGQANYAGANAFLDALVEARNRDGLPGVSLAWGPWSEVGMAAGPGGPAERLARSGVGALSNEEGLSFFDSAIQGLRGVAVVANVDWKRYAASVDPALHGVLPLATEAAQDAIAGKLGAELRATAAKQPEEATRRLEAYLQERIAEISGSRVISEHDSFFELGLDSLQAVAMRNRIERDLGIELSASLIFDYPTLADLRAHLLADHLGIRTGDGAAAADAGTPLWDAFPPLAHVANGAHEENVDAELLAQLEAGMRSLERELGG
jgi:nucleoside-diphosphate-sugar epimerase/acyl carrier protein